MQKLCTTTDTKCKNNIFNKAEKVLWYLHDTRGLSVFFIITSSSDFSSKSDVEDIWSPLAIFQSVETEGFVSPHSLCSILFHKYYI